MSDETKTRQMRLHIGAISKQLAADISSIESRFSKYGKVVSPLELHEKPALETYFGFITMELTPAKFGALKGALNGVKFKGSTLTIAEARPDWQARWEADQARPDPPLSRSDAIRKFERPRREVDVIPGRERTVPRRNKHTMTVRVFIGKRKKILHCTKKKLWGFMKEKKLDDLVAEYSHGKWRDHHGDIIETVDLKLKTSKKSTASTSTGIKEKAQVVGSDDDGDEDEEMKEERNRNLNILQTMFGAGDDDSKNDDRLPAPMEVDESDESDWEKLTKKQTKIAMDPAFADENDYYEEPEQINEPQDAEVQEEPENTKETSPTEPKESTTTSALRALFNPTEEAEPFSLFGGNNDEDEDVVMDDPIETPVVVIEQPKVSAKQPAPRIYAGTNKGLFFPHFDSPFLHAQSQVATLAKYTLDKEAWQKEFYESRGEWNRTLRRRRRDVVRQIHKKNQAKRRTVAI